MRKHLILIDLDGTLLVDSSTSQINPKDKKAINAARKAGHIICIATGRPWRASRKAYEALGLNTVISNYNGAQIHNPKDYNFNQYISYMNLNDVMFVLGDEKLKNAMSNVAIEGPGWVMVDRRDKDLERVFGFKDAAKLKVGFNPYKLPLKPTGVIFDTKEGVNIAKLHDYLQRTYGDLVEFSSWSKGDGLTPVFDMTNVGVTKAKALSLMARYYKIPVNRTIAIGDGYNDVPMFEAAEFSVAVGNASDDIKAKATYVCENTNKTGAIAEFLEKFLEDDSDFMKNLKKRRKELRNIREEIVKAH